jgi:hypothetical protein
MKKTLAMITVLTALAAAAVLSRGAFDREAAMVDLIRDIEAEHFPDDPPMSDQDVRSWAKAFVAEAIDAVKWIKEGQPE